MPDDSKDKPMLLSEAIRLGAKLGPQAFGKLHDENTQGTCAIGAAFQVLGEFRSEHQWCVAKIPIRCPDCGREKKKIYHIITHLNDHHRWSREAIADWVETLENRGVQRHGSNYRSKTDTQTVA